jgi:uncharacterized protein HemY
MTALERPSPEAVAAQPEAERLLANKPDYVPALMVQAASYLQQANAESAAALYARVLKKFPDFAPAQARLAAIYSEDPQKLNAAYDFAIKARKALSDDPDLARTLATLSFKRNEFSYAIQLFQQSNARQPLPARDLYYLGLAQLHMKQNKNGRQALESALAAGLQDPLAQDARKHLAELGAE